MSDRRKHMDCEYGHCLLGDESPCLAFDPFAKADDYPQGMTLDEYTQPAPTPAVKGQRIRLTRLDAQGRPTGEPFEVTGSLAFPETNAIEVAKRDWLLGPISMGVTFKHVDPDVIGLLYGVSLPPRPWWWRFIPRPIKHKIKRREIRRGYGG